MIFSKIIKKILVFGMSALITFAICDSLVTLLPGNPIDILIEETGTSISREWLENELQIHRSLPTKIFSDLKRIANSDWGRSLVSQEEILPTLSMRAIQSVKFASIVYFWSLLIALTVAPLSAVREFQGRPFLSKIISVWGWLSGSVSSVWIGPVFLVIFTHLLPLANPVGSIALASFTLVLLFTGGALRMVREQVRESVQNGSVRGALARGFSDTNVAFREGFLPVSGMLFSYFGSNFGALMAGAFVSETVFSLPGLGSYLVKSILMRDFVAIQGALFVSILLCLFGTLVGEVMQLTLDPRNRALS